MYQLVARIRRGSKYRHQAPPGEWFNIHLSNTHYSPVLGNNNVYNFSDVVIGARLEDGSIADFGKGGFTA